MKKPGKVTAIEVMVLVAGVFGIIMGFSLMWTIVWIPWIYSYIFGIIAIVVGARLLASPGYLNGQPPEQLPKPPFAVGVLAIINILCCDVTSLTLGILIVVFLGDPEVKDYYAGRWVPPPPPAAAYYGPTPQGYAPVQQPHPQQPPAPEDSAPEEPEKS